VRLSFDKIAVETAARTVDLITPPSAVVRDVSEVPPLVRRYGRVVAKSRFAIGQSSDGRRSHGGRKWICGTEDQAIRAVATILDAEDEALVQAMVDGPEYGLGFVRAKGGDALHVVTLRIRSWPPTGGSPSLLRSVAPPIGLVGGVARLLESLEWAGVAQADVVWTHGAPVLLDLNARIWATVGSSIAAGVNVPAAVLDVALDRPLVASTPELGVGWADADTELRYLVCLLADRRGVRRPGESLFDALRRQRADLRRPIVIDPLSRDDLLPALGHLLFELPATLLRNRRIRQRQPRAG
jgi:hypothetical protein